MSAARPPTAGRPRTSPPQHPIVYSCSSKWIGRPRTPGLRRSAAASVLRSSPRPGRVRHVLPRRISGRPAAGHRGREAARAHGGLGSLSAHRLRRHCARRSTVPSLSRPPRAVVQVAAAQSVRLEAARGPRPGGSASFLHRGTHHTATSRPGCGREAAQQHAVDDAVAADRRRRADAERDRGRRDRGERPAAAERAEGEAQVVRQPREPRHGRVSVGVGGSDSGAGRRFATRPAGARRACERFQRAPARARVRARCARTPPRPRRPARRRRTTGSRSCGAVPRRARGAERARVGRAAGRPAAGRAR